MLEPTKITVRYAETDRMGIVYHANYLVWFDIARTELLQQLGYPYHKIEEAGIMSPVLEANVKYGAPFTFGDVAIIYIDITKLTGAKTEYSYRVYKEGDDYSGKPRLTGSTLHCLVDSKTFKPLIQKKALPELYAIYQQLLVKDKE